MTLTAAMLNIKPSTHAHTAHNINKGQTESTPNQSLFVESHIYIDYHLYHQLDLLPSWGLNTAKNARAAVADFSSFWQLGEEDNQIEDAQKMMTDIRKEGRTKMGI